MTGHHELAAPSMGVSWHATHLGALYMLTVGDPLSTIKGVTILSDSTKKKYRRLSIIDDRLVGYLSLGSTQPDSLAIKRIIDEGLSIRSVKRALLKGDFDVRKYFSQSRSRAAQDMLTSGKIHVVNPLVSSLPVTDPLVRAHPQRITPGGVLLSLPPPTTSRMERPHTEPLHGPVPVLPSIDSQLTIHEWEEGMRPSTDKLPASSKPVLPSIDSQLTIHEWEEEMRPSTDKLPASSKRVVESILVPLPSRPTSRNLWSYSEKIPVIVARPSSTQRPGPAKAEKASGHEKVGRTNFLL